MDLLEIIKNRRTIRKYKDEPIPKEIIDKIIEAGIWGPSIPSFLKIQPWRIIVIKNNTYKKKLSEIVLNKSKQSGIGINILLKSAANIIESAPVVVVIYNSGDLKRIKIKYKEFYKRFAKIIPSAELAAISATIQNMILTAESLGVGSCWLDTPLFCKKNINKLLNTNDELIALLTLGYPAQKGKRSKRKPRDEAVKYIK